MSLRKLVPLLLVAGVASITGATAQTAPAAAPAPNTEFRITKVTPEFQDSPAAAGTYNKKVGRPQKWLEIEASFDWQPRLKEPLYLDEITVTYYILLANAAANKDRKPTLLSGTVTHIDTPHAKDLRSSIYISPRSLEKLFGGTAPNNPAQAVIDIGVTISQGGQVVADYTLKGKGAWWNNAEFKAVAGIAVPKSDTPFANAAWDYFEPIKSKSGQ